jgi:hypothetical protein
MASSSTRYTEHDLDRIHTRFAINCRLVSRSLLNHPWFIIDDLASLRLNWEDPVLSSTQYLCLFSLIYAIHLFMPWCGQSARLKLVCFGVLKVRSLGTLSVSVKWERNIISLSDWRLIMQSIDYELYQLSVSLRRTLCTWCKLVVCNSSAIVFVIFCNISDSLVDRSR